MSTIEIRERPAATAEAVLGPHPARRQRRGHLLVMAHFVRTGRVGGAEPMLYNLLRGLASGCGGLDIACSKPEQLDPDFVAQMASLPGTRLRVAGGPGPRFLAEQRACLDPRLEADAVLFPNYFVPPVLPARLGRVGTVLHDLQYAHYPQYFSRRKRAWLRFAQKLALHRADRVIVISRFVAEDVLARFGRAAERKLVIVPNPISWDRFGVEDGAPPPLAGPYVLAVAAQYPHKNLETLVRGFAQAARARAELRLVLCGRDYNGLHGVVGRRAGLGELIAALGIADRVQLTGHVDDAALGRWYRGAALFAFPSLFEGFGMPPVEALGFGLPVLTTRCTAIPETTLGLASYVDDPLDAGEWAARIIAMTQAPAAHAPSAAEVALLRSYYAPERIAERYLQALLD